MSSVKTYTGAVTTREARPRSKRLQGLGGGVSSGGTGTDLYKYLTAEAAAAMYHPLRGDLGLEFRAEGITFGVRTEASATDHLEVIEVGGVQYLHTRLPFYSDGEVASGIPGSGGGSGGGSVVRWNQIQGAGVKIAEITIDGVVTNVYAPESGSDVAWQTSQYSGYAGLKVGGADARQVALYGHNHDGRYSLASHDHDSRYSLLGHDHDSRYSLLGHDHDSRYSLLGHDHDSRYSLLGHDHDSRYYLKTEVDTALSGYVTLNTGQSIPGQKTFTSRILADGGLRVRAGSVLTTNHGEALRLDSWTSGNDVAGRLLPVAGSLWSLGTATNRWAAIFGDQIYIPARSSAIHALFNDGSSKPIFRVYTDSDSGIGDVNFGIDPGQGNAPTHDVNFIGRVINFRNGNYEDAASTALAIAPNSQDADGRTVLGNIYVSRHMRPNASNTYDLGADGISWRFIYGYSGKFQSGIDVPTIYSYNNADHLDFYVSSNGSRVKGLEVKADGLYAAGSKVVLTEANWSSYVGNNTANKVMYAANADCATNAEQLGGVAASSYMLKVSGATAGNVALFATGGGLRDSGIPYSNLALLSGNNTFTGYNTFKYAIDILNGGVKLSNQFALQTWSGGPLLVGDGTVSEKDVYYYAHTQHLFSIYDSSLENPSWNPVFYINNDYVRTLRRFIPDTGSSSGEQGNGIDLGDNTHQWRRLYARRWYPNGSSGPYIEYDSTANAFKVYGNMYVTGFLSSGYTGTNDVQSAISYSLVPTQVSTYDLGSTLKPFRTLYIQNIGSSTQRVSRVYAGSIEATTSVEAGTMKAGDLDVSGTITLPSYTFATGKWSDGIEAALEGTSGNTYNLGQYGLDTNLAESIYNGEIWVLKTDNYTLRVTGSRKNGERYTIYCGGFVLRQLQNSDTTWYVYKTA